MNEKFCYPNNTFPSFEQCLKETKLIFQYEIADEIEKVNSPKRCYEAPKDICFTNQANIGFYNITYDPYLEYFLSLNNERRGKTFPTFIKRTNEKDQTLKVSSAFLDDYLPKLIHQCSILDIGVGEGDLSSKVATYMKGKCNNIRYEGIDRSEQFVANATKKLLTVGVRDQNIIIGDCFGGDIDQLVTYPTLLIASQVVFYAPDIGEFIDKIIKKIGAVALIIGQSDFSFLNELNKKNAPAYKQKDTESKVKSILSAREDVSYVNILYASIIEFPDEKLVKKVSYAEFNFLANQNERESREILEFIAGAPLEYLEYSGKLPAFINDVSNHLGKLDGNIGFWNFMAITVPSKDASEEELKDTWLKIQKQKFNEDLTQLQNAFLEENWQIVEELTNYFKYFINLRRDKTFPTFIKNNNEIEQTIKVLSAFLDEFIPKVTHKFENCRVLDLGLGEGELSAKIATYMQGQCNSVRYEGIGRSELFVGVTRNKLMYLGIPDQNIIKGDCFSRDIDKLEPHPTLLVVSHTHFYAHDLNKFINQIITKLGTIGMIVGQSETSFSTYLSKYYGVYGKYSNLENRLDFELTSNTDIIKTKILYSYTLKFPQEALIEQIALGEFGNFSNPREQEAREILEFITGNTLEYLESKGKLGSFIEDFKTYLELNHGEIILWNYIFFLIPKTLLNENELYMIWEIIQFTFGLTQYEKAFNEGNIKIVKDIFKYEEHQISRIAEKEKSFTFESQVTTYNYQKQYLPQNLYIDTEQMSFFSFKYFGYLLGIVSDKDVIKMDDYGMYKGGSGRDQFIVHPSFAGKEQGWKLIIKDYTFKDIIDLSIFGPQIKSPADLQYEKKLVMNKPSTVLFTADSEEIVTLYNFQIDEASNIEFKFWEEDKFQHFEVYTNEHNEL